MLNAYQRHLRSRRRATAPPAPPPDPFAALDRTRADIRRVREWDGDASTLEREERVLEAATAHRLRWRGWTG